MKNVLIISLVILFFACEKDDDSSQLQAPVALEASKVTSKSFRASWMPSDRATAYVIDVATDLDFSMIINSWEIEKPGNLACSCIYIYSLNGNTEYYYRLRATMYWGDDIISDNSNVISVITLP